MFIGLIVYIFFYFLFTRISLSFIYNTDILLVSSAVYTVLDFNNLSWPKFLEMVCCSWRDILGGKISSIDMVTFAAWQDVHKFRSPVTFEGDSLGHKETTSFPLLPRRLYIR